MRFCSRHVNMLPEPFLRFVAFVEVYMKFQLLASRTGHPEFADVYKSCFQVWMMDGFFMLTPANTLPLYEITLKPTRQVVTDGTIYGCFCYGIRCAGLLRHQRKEREGSESYIAE